MKVLHFVSVMDRAGQETLIMNLYRNINKEEIQFGFLCSEHRMGDYDSEIFSLGGEINYITLNRKTGKLRHIDNYFVLKNELKKYTDEYDVFHIHNHHAFDSYISARAAVKAGFKKVIVHSHSSSAEEHLKLHNLFKKPLSALPVVKLVCSDGAGEWMFADKEYTVINNGIDADKFAFDDKARSDYRKALGIENEFVIGHVGRFMYVKNHEFIVRIFNEYRKTNENTHLLLVGNGEDFEKIKNLVRDLNLEKDVSMLGVREDTAALYCAMDMFFMPSLFEGLPVVSVEAQCSGLPCLLSDTVSKEAEMSDIVLWESLDSPMEKWVEQIQQAKNISLNSDRKSYVSRIRNAHYDIIETVKLMEMIYSK